MKRILTFFTCLMIFSGLVPDATAQKKGHNPKSAFASMIKEWKDIAKVGEDGSKNRNVTWTLRIDNATSGSRTGFIGGNSNCPVVIMPTKPYYDARFPNLTEAPIMWSDAIIEGRVPNNVSIGTWVEFSGRYYMNVNGSQQVFFIDRISKIAAPKQ